MLLNLGIQCDDSFPLLLWRLEMKHLDPFNLPNFVYEKDQNSGYKPETERWVCHKGKRNKAGCQLS